MANYFVEQEGQPVQLTDEEQQIVKEAVLRHENFLEIDSAEELKRFRRMLLWRKKRTRILWTAAASLIFIIGIGTGLFFAWDNPFQKNEIAIYEAAPADSSVLIYMDGKPITLSSDSAMAMMQRMGMKVGDKQIECSPTTTPQETTLSVPYGSSYCVKLADGTLVELNAHSRLTYPTAFTGVQREVELYGEAYFVVARDASHPFIVHSDGLETKVLGTEFNIRNYGGEPGTVTLVKGSIEVTAGNYEPVILKPGQNLSYTGVGTNVKEVSNVDTREYTEWRSGFFYFDNKSLSEVFRIVGRYYNVSVMCQEYKLMKTHFNLWIDMNKSLEENLDLINEVGNLHAVLVDNKVIVK